MGRSGIPDFLNRFDRFLEYVRITWEYVIKVEFLRHIEVIRVSEFWATVHSVVLIVLHAACVTILLHWSLVVSAAL